MEPRRHVRREVIGRFAQPLDLHRPQKARAGLERVASTFNLARTPKLNLKPPLFIILDEFWMLAELSKAHTAVYYPPPPIAVAKLQKCISRRQKWPSPGGKGFLTLLPTRNNRRLTVKNSRYLPLYIETRTCGWLRIQNLKLRRLLIFRH